MIYIHISKNDLLYLIGYVSIVFYDMWNTYYNDMIYVIS